MENLNSTQVANFCYWLNEKNNNRGLLDNDGKDLFRGKERINHIENVLLPEFLKKYPDGILTGWCISEKESIIKKIHSITKEDWMLIANFAEKRKNEPFHSLMNYEHITTYHFSSGYACVCISVFIENKICVSTRRNGANDVEGQSEILKILKKYGLENIYFAKGY